MTIANNPFHPSQGLNASGMPTHAMQYGITLRAYYAGIALAGLASNPNWQGSPQGMAKDAIEIADALIEALE